MLTQLHFKLLTGAHLLRIECQLHQLCFQQHGAKGKEAEENRNSSNENATQL